METSVSVIRFPGCVFTDLPQIDNFLCFQKLFLTSVLLLGKKTKNKKKNFWLLGSLSCLHVGQHMNSMKMLSYRI